MNEIIDKKEDKEVDGNKYKNCICWKNVAGYGEGCFDGYCSYAQRMACSYQQDLNRK